MRTLRVIWKTQSLTHKVRSLKDTQKVWSLTNKARAFSPQGGFLRWHPNPKEESLTADLVLLKWGLWQGPICALGGIWSVVIYSQWSRNFTWPRLFNWLRALSVDWGCLAFSHPLTGMYMWPWSGREIFWTCRSRVVHPSHVSILKVTFVRWWPQENCPKPTPILLFSNLSEPSPFLSPVS